VFSDGADNLRVVVSTAVAVSLVSSLSNGRGLANSSVPQECNISGWRRTAVECCRAKGNDRSLILRMFVRP
jgi:hypothetical protein